jgi:hypothetical protein
MQNPVKNNQDFSITRAADPLRGVRGLLRGVLMPV